MLHSKQTAAFPISHAGQTVALGSIRFCFCEYFDATVCPQTSASQFKMKRVCISFTQMGKASSPHLRAFHWKPIRLDIPTGDRPSLSGGVL